MFWTHGFKPDNTGERWYHDVALIMLEKYDKIERRVKTSESETSLAIPTSMYFYLATANELYGNGVFFFSVPTDWELNEKGISPFDTGGLRARKIKTDPPLADDELEQLFYQHNYPLNSWHTRFSSYITQNYDSILSYIWGEAPSLGVCPIIKTTDNKSLAWAWEGRIRKEILKERVKVQHFYCNIETSKFLIREVPPLELSREDWSAALNLLKSMVTVCAEDTSPTLIASYDLARGLNN